MCIDNARISYKSVIAIISIFALLLSGYVISKSSPRIQHACLSSTKPKGLFITSSFKNWRRLGNVMFNYASLVGISAKTNMTPIAKDNFDQLYNIFQVTAPRENHINCLDIEFKNHYTQLSGTYDSTVETLDVHTDLIGFYQSWLYFSESINQIREQFRFRNTIIQKADRYSEENNIECKKCIRVGIHVRRGDMTRFVIQYQGFTVAPPEYFTEAMTYFRNKYKERQIQFIVCSDDITWCKQNIVADDVVFSESGSAVIDLLLLSRCDHVIMSTGTFGWWAGFLSGGTTIYYKNWPRKGSSRDKFYTKDHFFLRNWIPMNGGIEPDGSEQFSFRFWLSVISICSPIYVILFLIWYHYLNIKVKLYTCLGLAFVTAMTIVWIISPFFTLQ